MENDTIFKQDEKIVENALHYTTAYMKMYGILNDYETNVEFN